MRRTIFLPKPATARNALASKATSPFAGNNLDTDKRDGLATSLLLEFGDRDNSFGRIRLGEPRWLRGGRTLVVKSHLRRIVTTPHVNTSQAKHVDISSKLSRRRRQYFPVANDCAQSLSCIQLLLLAGRLRGAGARVSSS